MYATKIQVGRVEVQVTRINKGQACDKGGGGCGFTGNIRR